jgi:hypothetical protein
VLLSLATTIITDAPLPLRGLALGRVVQLRSIHELYSRSIVSNDIDITHPPYIQKAVPHVPVDYNNVQKHREVLFLNILRRPVEA